MAKIFILGHKNSDTDSICSSLAYAELKRKLGFEAQAVLAEGSLNKETEFVLKNFNVRPPAENWTAIDDVFFVLIDHNEPSQIDSRVNLDKVIEIIDHHKLGGLTLSVPIRVDIRPLGSSSTLIYKFYEENKVAPEPLYAQLLLCGIISDTLLLTSPTTTEEDKKALEKLAQLSGISDSRSLAEKMFQAKSDISEIPLSDVIFADFKVFDMVGRKVGIGVFETTSPFQILARGEEIFKILEAEKAKYDLLFFAAIDIFQKNAYLFLSSEKEKKVAEAVFGKEYKDKDILFLKGVVSRKKQIVPPLQEYLEKKNEGI